MPEETKGEEMKAHESALVLLSCLLLAGVLGTALAMQSDPDWESEQ